MNQVDDLKRLYSGYDELVSVSKNIIRDYSDIPEMSILEIASPKESVNDVFLHRFIYRYMNDVINGREFPQTTSFFQDCKKDLHAYPEKRHQH